MLKVSEDGGRPSASPGSQRPEGIPKPGAEKLPVPEKSAPLGAASGKVVSEKPGSGLHDKQSEPDHRELRIDKVGVRGLRFPIQIRDKAKSLQNTVATIGLFVDLPKEFKGTHMSRFIEVLNAHGSVVHVENIVDIVGSSRVDLQACKLEYSIVSPK